MCCAWFDYYDQLPICSSVRMVFDRREPQRLVNLHSFGLVVSLVNTLPKGAPYATDFYLFQNNFASLRGPKWVLFRLKNFSWRPYTGTGSLHHVNIHLSYSALKTNDRRRVKTRFHTKSPWLFGEVPFQNRPVRIRPITTEPLKTDLVRNVTDLLITDLLITDHVHNGPCS